MGVRSSSDYRVILGAAIREERKRAGLSQEKLAERADLHPNYVGRVERGEEHVSLAALRRIARALKVRLSELVKDI
jgi:transcriptional regulator with XRE-family HTH domain